MSGLKNKLLSVFMALTFCVISVFCPFVSVQAIDPITAAIIGFVVEEAVDYLIQYAYENRFKTFEQCAYVVSFWSSVVSSESLTKSQFEELVLYYYSGYLSDIENNPNFINDMSEDEQQAFKLLNQVAYDSHRYFVCRDALTVENPTLEEIDELYNLAVSYSVGINKSGKPSLPASEFKKYIETSNNEYSPKSTGKYISYRTEKMYEEKQNAYLSLYSGGFCGERWNEVYLMPFYTDGEDRYYSEYQLHFYLERVDNESGDGWTTSFVLEWFSNFDDIDPKKGTYVIKEGMTSPEYVAFAPTFYDGNRPYVFMYSSFTDFSTRRNHNLSLLIKTFPERLDYFKSGDFSTFVESNHNTFVHFNQIFSAHDTACVYGVADDVGYYYSNTPIMFSYSNIDTEKIPDSYYITVNGDTIYDYSITNPDTGQSSTINEYITNNYTYITNNNPGGDGSGSGTTGGNVTVGGNIGVNGNVNVGGEVNVGVDVSPIDINVNVSENGGAGESAPNLEAPDTSIFDGYLNSALDETTGIRKFIADFFGGLLGEITTLICICLVFAILCRLLGR